MFSIIVKSEPFTKHIGCQSGCLNLFQKRSNCCSATIIEPASRAGRSTRGRPHCLVKWADKPLCPFADSPQRRVATIDPCQIDLSSDGHWEESTAQAELEAPTPQCAVLPSRIRAKPVWCRSPASHLRAP